MSPEIGQMFVYKTISKALLLNHLPHVVWEREDASEDTFLTGMALDMLSLPLSKTEIDESKLSSVNKEHGATKLSKLGAVLLKEAIPGEMCEELSEFMHSKTMGASEEDFGDIMEAKLRKDLPLPLNEITMPIIRHVLNLARPLLEEKLGKEPMLVELSSLISYPNATAQDVHPDFAVDEIINHNDANIVSVFCYLADVDENMAALDLYPGTHMLHFHMSDEAEHAMQNSIALRLAVPKGTFVLMDSRTFHRGTNNTTPRRRPVFYFSFMERLKPIPEGPTYSIRDDVMEMNFTISSLLAYIEGTLRRLKEGTNGSTLIAAENSVNTSSDSSHYLKGSLNGSYFQSYGSNVSELGTINYLNEINRSNYTFVCFFDPRSAAFSLLQNVFGNASAMAGRDNARYGNVRFVAIDASRSLLNRKYSSYDYRLRKTKRP